MGKFQPGMSYYHPYKVPGRAPKGYSWTVTERHPEKRYPLSWTLVGGGVEAQKQATTSTYQSVATPGPKGLSRILPWNWTRGNYDADRENERIDHDQEVSQDAGRELKR